MIKTKFAAALALTALITAPAAAHRAWMVPSATVISGDDVWVSVDAAISNDLFYFEHQPMRGEPIVTAPDGTTAKAENLLTARYRTTFDVHLTQQGTYKIAYVNQGVGGTYKVNGEEKRLPRGLSADKLQAEIPAGATDIKLTQSASRNEIFVTSGAPTETVLKPTGQGLELAPVTHPNDLVAGEDATFQFLADGKPAANIKVTVIPGGVRYRDQLGDRELTTDGDGKVEISWPEPGLYWVNAVVEDNATTVPGATQRRLNYVAVLEVLAP